MCFGQAAAQELKRTVSAWVAEEALHKGSLKKRGFGFPFVIYHDLSPSSLPVLFLFFVFIFSPPLSLSFCLVYRSSRVFSIAVRIRVKNCQGWKQPNISTFIPPETPLSDSAAVFARNQEV